MIKTLSILIFLISISCLSQNTKSKTYYYFQNNEISKNEFESLDNRKIYVIETETDTCNIVNSYLQKNSVSLDSIALNQIKIFLSKTIGSEYHLEKKTMLHLYHQNDRNIYKDSKYEKYWKWINNNIDGYQSFLIGTKDSQIKTDKKKHIYLDQQDLLKKLFFSKSDFNKNHVLINPNGEIYIYFGLDDNLKALDWSVD